MKNVAVIENNTVVNIIVQNDSWVNPDTNIYIEYNNSSPAAIGWSVVNGVIIDPRPPQEPYPSIISGN